MFGHILTAIIGFFSQGVGNKVGSSVANVTAIAAALAAAYPLWRWFQGGGKNEVLFTLEFTVGESLFISLVVFALVKVVHYTRPGNPVHRHNFPRVPTDD